uniref:RING-type E3 ubiquitin transferase n=1 Tax=Leersia perrieri TaxID=77586 RepID=A0A0D9X7X1_9ORYZ
MGAPRARRWKLLLPPFQSSKRKPPLPPPPPPPVAVAPSPEKKEEEVVPEEFLCPISGSPMADPVILPPGRTFERACVDACAELSLSPPGASPAAAAIPNDALRAAIRTWHARSGRATPSPPSAAAARDAVLRARHTASARANAAAAVANLTLEPENRVPVVRAGAVPALVDVLSSSSAAAASPEACEHAAGALFGLALHEGNRAAIGVLGAVPPLLDLLTKINPDAATPRARRDAGMALYHLSLAAVNQSKLARSPSAAKNLLAIASSSSFTDPPIRRLALMVICNMAASTEGRAALMDAGAVATVTTILSNSNSEVEELCVAAMYGMSRGNPRFRALARAAGADRPLILVAEKANAGAHKEMARKTLRVVLGLGDYNDSGDLPDFMNSEGNVNGGVPVHRRRAASWAAAPPVATPTTPSSHQWRSVCID